jgi:hypothetical protein
MWNSLLLFGALSFRTNRLLAQGGIGSTRFDGIWSARSNHPIRSFCHARNDKRFSAESEDSPTSTFVRAHLIPTASRFLVPKAIHRLWLHQHRATRRSGCPGDWMPDRRCFRLCQAIPVGPAQRRPGPTGNNGREGHAEIAGLQAPRGVPGRPAWPWPGPWPRASR